MQDVTTNTIVCLGDSITYGMGVANPSQDAWPAVLERRLGESWSVVNLGVSGTTLMDEAHAPYRQTGKVDEAKRHPYAHAIVMIGTNDAFDPAWSEENYRRQLAELVDELAKAGSGTVKMVLMAPPAVFFGPERYERDQVPPDRMGGALRDIVRQVAAQKQAVYVDFYAFTQNHPEWFPDQLHPNEAGNRAMAEHLFETVFS